MIKTLFHFPYYHTKISPEKYNKSELVSSMINNYHIQPSRNKWNRNSDLHHNYNDENNDDQQKIDYSQLIPLYKDAIGEFIEELEFKEFINWNFMIENYTVTTKIQNMLPHHHIPYLFAAVHYLKFDPSEHKPTIFHNPSIYQTVLGIHYGEQRMLLDEKDPLNYWLWEDMHLNVEEDDLIIFPAIVQHSIGASYSEKERVTVALNVKIEKK